MNMDININIMKNYYKQQQYRAKTKNLLLIKNNILKQTDLKKNNELKNNDKIFNNININCDKNNLETIPNNNFMKGIVHSKGIVISKGNN